ncbi:DUF6683 family protein [Piscinibacter sp.]|uniref:DUF6683 family protein n=1 Tax=Piscinibacter sp. TaxID=1903157 RepID=UPI0039E254A6
MQKPPPSRREAAPRRIGGTLLLAAALSLTTLPARADPFLNMAENSAMMGRSVAAQMGMAAVSKSYYPQDGRPPGPRTQPKIAALRIGSDRAISREVRQRFRDGLVRANPGAEAAIDRALAKDWLQGYRTDIAVPNGLDARNLADVYAGYMIANWAIVHQRDTIAPQAIAAVRRTMAAQLGAGGAAAAMTGAERQRAGETMIYQTTLIMANREALAREGNAQRRQQAAEHYRRVFRQDSGVDLARLDLTDRGFVQR